jgi:large subunit ribosomal protein L17
VRHHNQNRKFGRKNDERKALIRSLSLALIRHKKIVTTEAKAKEMRPFVEKLVTRGKDSSLADQRIMISRLGNKEGVRKLINDIAPQYKKRTGGYTRIVKLPRRSGDASKMAMIEFV